jgi:hypothetical protein
VSKFGSLVAVFVASTTMAQAASVSTWFSTDPNPTSGLRGLHISRSSSDPMPSGISLDLDGSPVWDFGLDSDTPDLVLAYSHLAGAEQFRIRPDTGQIDIGPRVGHPSTQSQLNITAGTPDAPLDGLGVGCYGSRNGLYLYQKLPGTRRTKISFYNLFQVGTDSQRNNTPDFFIGNNATGRMPVVISPQDMVTLGYGATIGGTFQHTGDAAGFFGARPISRPVITGSRRDGTALINLIAGLTSLGLINNQTSR